MQVVKTVVVIVAHPDDETLWAGGTILSQPGWTFTIIALSRANDSDRAPRFFKALGILRATGDLGNLEDEPEQAPLSDSVVQNEILRLLPAKHYDLAISHSPSGEYTRHIRHEEVGRAVQLLWNSDEIKADSLWNFAYEDDGPGTFPKATKTAPIQRTLTDEIWRRKHFIITDCYGFQTGTYEEMATPKIEAFWPIGRLADCSTERKTGEKTK